jgi:hypothetical protein
MKPTKQTRLTEEPKTERSTLDRPADEFIELQSIPSKPEGPPPLPPEEKETREKLAEKEGYPYDSGARGRP